MNYVVLKVNKGKSIEKVHYQLNIAMNRFNCNGFKIGNVGNDFINNKLTVILFDKDCLLKNKKQIEQTGIENIKKLI